METLDISYNNIGDSGIIHLSETIRNNKLPALKHLILKEVDATHISLEKLFNSISVGAVLETIDISGNTLIPNNKKMNKKGGGKSLKKKLLNYTPNMKSLMGVVNGQLKIGQKLFEKNKKDFLLGMGGVPGQKNLKRNYEKKNKIKLLKFNNKILGNKGLKRGKSSNKDNDVKIKVKSIKTNKINKYDTTNKNKNELKKSPIITKKSKILKNKSKLTSPIITTMIISEDKLIEKSRARVLNSLVHTISVATNLKKIKLAKTGFTNFSSVLLINIFKKKIMLSKNKKLNDDSLIIEKEISVEIHDDISDNEKIDNFENSSTDVENIVPTSPYFKIPKEPDLIISLENENKTNVSIDSSFQPFVSKIILESNLSNPDDSNDNNSCNDDSDNNKNVNLGRSNDINNHKYKNIELINKRNIIVDLSLNDMSESSIYDVATMMNSI